MLNDFFKVTVAVTTTLCLTVSVWADGGEESLSAEQLYKMERLAALDADLPGTIQALAEQWAPQSGQSVDELIKLFRSASSDQLLALQDATSVEEVDGILLGDDSGTVNPLILGSLTRDYVYTAVRPCRIVDTRFAVGGGVPIPAGGTRDFHVHGGGLIISNQGGNNAGCPAPGGEPRAAHINVTVVPVGGNGFVKVFPDATPQPNASLVNFQLGTNIANAATIQTRFSTNASTPDISVFVANSSAHVIIDVLGYYYPATEAIEERELSSLINIPDPITTVGSLTIFVPGPGRVLVRGSATILCTGANTRVRFGVVNNLGGGYNQFNDAGLNAGVDTIDRSFPMAVEEVYTVSTSGFHTFYIRAEMFNADSAFQADVQRPVLIAHYVPE